MGGKPFIPLMVRSLPSEEQSDSNCANSQKKSIGNYKKTVMICEDDHDLLLAYRLALRSKYTILTAVSGDECIRKYSEMKDSGEPVDALLLDFRLGDTTGDDVAMRIRGLDGTKIILMSAYDIDGTMINSLVMNGVISLFVKKPVSLDRLASLIEATIGR